jgi:AcrR family transcriptional regulator
VIDTGAGSPKVGDDAEDRAVSRRARTDARITATVLAHLDRYGYAGLTIERVAADSGVAKTTIYRRWASKAEMVFDLALHRTDPPPLSDTGSLAGDVRLLAERSSALIAGKTGRAVLPGLFAEMLADPELATRIRESFGATASADVAGVLDRAAARGELEEQVDVAGFHAALLGIPYTRVHVFGESDTSRLADTLTSQLLAMLPTMPPAGRLET